MVVYLISAYMGVISFAYVMMSHNFFLFCRIHNDSLSYIANCSGGFLLGLVQYETGSQMSSSRLSALLCQKPPVT